LSNDPKTEFVGSVAMRTKMPSPRRPCAHDRATQAQLPPHVPSRPWTRRQPHYNHLRLLSPNNQQTQAKETTEKLETDNPQAGPDPPETPSLSRGRKTKCNKQTNRY